MRWEGRNKGWTLFKERGGRRVRREVCGEVKELSRTMGELLKWLSENRKEKTIEIFLGKRLRPKNPMTMLHLTLKYLNDNIRLFIWLFQYLVDFLRQKAMVTGERMKETHCGRAPSKPEEFYILLISVKVILIWIICWSALEFSWGFASYVTFLQWTECLVMLCCIMYQTTMT